MLFYRPAVAQVGEGHALNLVWDVFGAFQIRVGFGTKGKGMVHAGVKYGPK